MGREWGWRGIGFFPNTNKLNSCRFLPSDTLIQLIRTMMAAIWPDSYQDLLRIGFMHAFPAALSTQITTRSGGYQFNGLSLLSLLSLFLSAQPDGSILQALNPADLTTFKPEFPFKSIDSRH